ncbi:Internalin-I [Drechslerella dactyloides]|uniref:Internalin-I n=1 Tax=Drechslerella dactyloides TaxID=74499 RepID=A0AAD6IUT2_DREDA|nr:Internalin-I [Drechslerella dactyloides]
MDMDSFEGEDWVPESQPPAPSPQRSPAGRNPIKAADQARRKSVPTQSFIPRASRIPKAPGAKVLPDRRNRVHDENQKPKPTPVADDNDVKKPEGTPDVFVQAATPTASAQGTMVRRRHSSGEAGAPTIFFEKGSDDLFTPNPLEKIFKQPESRETQDVRPQSSPASNLPSPQSLVEGEPASETSQLNGVAPSTSNFDSTNERFSEADNPFFATDRLAPPATPYRYSPAAEDGRSRDPQRRDPHWGSTPPRPVGQESMEYPSEQLRSSLFREATPSPPGKDGEYLNSISTSAFSDQSPGLNELLHVTSKSEFSKQLFMNQDYTDFQPEQSSLSQNNQIYYATPDRQFLQSAMSGNASVTTTPDTFQHGWSPLRLFSSKHDAHTKATRYRRISQMESDTSSYDEGETSFSRFKPRLSFASTSKRMWDGTPVSCQKSPNPNETRSPDLSRSYCLHPPSPVKENQPKRQKMSLPSARGAINGGQQGDITDDNIEDSKLRYSSVIEGGLSPDDISDLQESTSKLRLEPEINFSRSPPNFSSKPQFSSSLNVILAAKVKHMMPSKVGDMVFDEKRLVWRHQHDKSEDAEREAAILHNRQGIGGKEDVLSDDPFYEISDLPASPNPHAPLRDTNGKINSPTARLILNAFKKQLESRGASSVGASPMKGRSVSPVANKPDQLPSAPIHNAADTSLIDDSLSDTSTSSLRPTSPDFDPQKGRSGKVFTASPSQESSTATSVGADTHNDSLIQGEETLELNRTKNATPVISSAVEGSYIGFTHPQSTPREPLRQYTVSMQASGRQPNGTVVSIRKSEFSFWNTPLTDITYHYLEGDSRMNSGYSGRGYQSRTGRQLRKLNREKGSMAIKNMVKHLTDNDMFGPYWDQNKALQIQKQGIEHVQDLAGFHPNLVEVNLEHNELTHLMGLPSTVRDLKVAGNQLSSLTAWNHLTNLQFLDISRNSIDNLLGLSSLIHLRELKADDNEITSLEGILHLDGLMKVRLRRNRLTSVDLTSSNLRHLKNLDLGFNSIDQISSLHHLPEISSLNLDSNNLHALELPPGQEVRTLRTLNASNNRLTKFDVTPFPNIRTLYLDTNQLEDVAGISGAHHLDSFSIRSQSGALKMPLESLYETRKVYASGNPILSFQVDYYFNNLQYLELASCSIRNLPNNFGRLMSNVRILNLNNNAISDIKPLSGIVRLKKLYLVGNRISNLQKFSNVLRLLPSLSELDLRHNPLTLGFYAVLSKCTDIAIKADEELDPSPFLLQHQNSTEDNRFQCSMTEDTAVARRCYEILIGEQCPQITYLDGLSFDIEQKLRQDRVWDRMTKLGLVFEAPARITNDTEVKV